MKTKAIKKSEIKKFNKEVIKIITDAGYNMINEINDDYHIRYFEKTNDWGFKHNIGIVEVPFPITYFEINTQIIKNGIIEKDNISSIDYDYAINELNKLIEFANDFNCDIFLYQDSILSNVRRIAVRTNKFTTEHYKDFYIGAKHISEFSFEGCPAGIRETVYEEILKVEKSY